MMDFLGRHHLAIIWVLLILVISIITGVFFQYYGNPFIQDFISSGLSTLLGAIVGVPIAIWIATHQEGQTAKRKNQKIITVLRRELIDNLEILSDFENSLAGDGIATVVVRDETWKAFSDAGELHWIKD